MPKVKLQRLQAGPDGVFRPGDIIDVSNEEANYLVDSGQAQLVDQPKKPKQPKSDSLLDGNVNEVKAKITIELGTEKLDSLLAEELEGADRKGIKEHIETLLVEAQEDKE